MNTRKRSASFLIAGTAIAVALLSMSGIATAEHIEGVCAIELNGVEVAVNESTYEGPRADANRDSLLMKLDDADAKLDQDKPDRAIVKLTDISEKAESWSAAPKPKLETAEGITGSVATAITCISG